MKYSCCGSGLGLTSKVTVKVMQTVPISALAALVKKSACCIQKHWLSPIRTFIPRHEIIDPKESITTGC